MMVCARDVWARSLRIDGEHVKHDQLVAPDHIRVEEAGRDVPIMHHERDLWCGRGLPEERSDGLAKAATDLRQIVALWSEASFFPVILRHAPDADKAANFGEACGERCKRGVVARESGAEKHCMGRVTWSGDPDRPRVGQIEQVVPHKPPRHAVMVVGVWWGVRLSHNNTHNPSRTSSVSPETPMNFFFYTVLVRRGPRPKAHVLKVRYWKPI